MLPFYGGVRRAISSSWIREKNDFIGGDFQAARYLSKKTKKLAFFCPATMHYISEVTGVGVLKMLPCVARCFFSVGV